MSLSRDARLRRAVASSCATCTGRRPAAGALELAALLDLGPAAEAVRHHQRVLGRRPHRGEQPVLGARHRHVVVARLEAEVAGEAAAAGVEHVGVDAGALHQLDLGVLAEDGVLVAVHLHDGLRGRAESSFGGSQSGARSSSSSPSVFVCRRQPLDVAVLGEEVLASARNTAVQLGSRPDHRGAGGGVRGQRCRRPAQDLLGDAQLAGGDPGEAAAILLRDPHGEARRPRAPRPRRRRSQGERWLVKVSGHSSTSPREPSPRGRSPRRSSRLNHVVNRIRPKSGMVRCWSMPPAALISGVDARGCALTPLTSPGASARDPRPDGQPAHRVVGRAGRTRPA